MLSYHNDPALKESRIARVRAHREADNLIQGTGWENGKGCAVGCTMNSYYHEGYPVELGIPEALAYIEDEVFERLTPADAQQWPEAFLRTIPVGVDLEPAVRRILSRILSEIALPAVTVDEWGVRDAVRGVITALESGEGIETAWDAARAATWDATRAAADATGDAAAAAAAAAMATASDAAGATADAARDAARATAWGATDAAAWLKIRDIVLEEVAR